MISPTADWTECAAGTSPRSCAASLPTSLSPPRTRRSHRTDALQQRVERPRLELVRDAIGDQPGGAVGDLLAHHEPVLAQRRAGRRQIDDPLDQSGQRRELDRALDLDDLRLAPGLEEVPRRDPGYFVAIRITPSRLSASAARSSPATVASTIVQWP